jgi:hypothetical protein
MNDSLSDPSFPGAMRRQALRSLGTWLAAPLLPTLGLAGCGGDGDDGSGGVAVVRAVNLMSDVPSLDLYVDDTRSLAALGRSVSATGVELSAGSRTLKLRPAGESTLLFSGSYSLEGGAHYTAVAWGRSAVPRLSNLPEDYTDSDIGSTDTRLRVLAATQDGGSLDVYVTAEAAVLADATPRLSSVTAGQLTGFAEFPAGTWRLRVTGAGDVNDVRLDVSGVALATQKHHTLVLSPAGGGVLVDGLLVLQQGTVLALPNTQARVRIVASAGTAAVVAVSRSGRTLASGLRSPSVGPYLLVDAGNEAFTVRVNGVVVDAGTLPLAAGTDHTLLVMADGGVRLLVDDNRLPSNSARMRLRLVHAVAGLDELTLSVNYLALLTDVVAGTGSEYLVGTTTSAALLEVTSPSQLAAVFSDDEVSLLANSVYTVFVLDGTTGGPTAVIRKER